jgi:hypothetical protein
MSSRQARIICDRAKAPVPQAGDCHGMIVHHRYYGSSAVNGGERLAETRRGKRPRPVNVCGF